MGDRRNRFFGCAGRVSQFGLSLLEVLLALTIATSLLIGISSYLWDQSRAQQDVAVAQFHNLVTQAAQNYIQDNYSTIQSGTFPASITISQLSSGGYLASGMSSVNSLGQTVCVKIIQPTASTLSALVMGTGATTTYTRAAHIAGLIGTLGGAVDSTGAINGTGGSWTIGSSNTASYGTCSSGSLSIGQFVSMLYFSNGSLVSDFLHRSYVGSTAGNTMNVPLGLSTKTSGVDCTGYLGFISRDTSGNVLSCVLSGSAYTWTATGGSWKSPVTSYGSLPSTGNTDGDVRMETTNYRAFAWKAASAAWVALAVDSSGNMAVPGTLTAGALSTTGNVNASGAITSASTVTGNTFAPTLTATEGASCAAYPSGSVANNSDGSGLVLTCQSSVWHTQLGSYNLSCGTVSRSLGVTYTNPLYKPITVSLNINQSTGVGGYAVYVNGGMACYLVSDVGYSQGTCTVTVPAKGTYMGTYAAGVNAPASALWNVCS